MNSKKVFIGIDPGKAGFITILFDNIVEFYPMPTHKVSTGELNKSGSPKMKSEFHEAGLVDLVIEINRKYKLFEIHVGIEKVSGRHGWSAENNFNFGYVAGMQKLMMLFLRPATLTMVRPQKWQAEMYSGVEKIMIPSSTGKTFIHDTKATSAKVATLLAPDINFAKTDKSVKIDDNKTDSFLIAKYIEKFLNKNKI